MIALPLTGWIFDIYPTHGGMAVWIVDEAGRSHRFVDPFQPRFYAAGPIQALRQLVADLSRVRLAEPVGMTRRQEFWTGEPRDVLELLLLDPELQPALLRRLAVPRPGITLYDCDLAPTLTYYHTRGILPLARVTASSCSAPHSALRTPQLPYAVDGSAWDLDYPEPPLTLMALTCEGDEGGRGGTRRAARPAPPARHRLRGGRDHDRRR